MPSKFNKTSSKANFNRMSEPNSSFKNYLNRKTDFQWYDYPFTIICSAFLIVIHFLFWILAPTPDVFFSIPPYFVELFAQNNYIVVSDGQWYRLITSIFIHANIVHLAGNLLFFVIFSIRLEEIYGWKIVFIIFMIAGLSGNVLTLLISWNNINITSLGASGAIEGVFMADLVVMRKTYDKGSLTMLAFLVIFASFTIAGSNSNFFAHLGGLIGGGFCMFGLEKLEKSNMIPILFR